MGLFKKIKKALKPPSPKKVLGKVMGVGGGPKAAPAAGPRVKRVVPHYSTFAAKRKP
jgi:hypothetical protein